MSIMTNNKKRRLSDFFIKRFIPLFIAAVVLCAIATVTEKSLTITYSKTASNLELSNMCNTVRDAMHQENPEQRVGWEIRAFGDFNHSEAGRNSAVVVTDSETGEILFDSTFAVYAVYRQDKQSPTEMYICQEKEVTDYVLQYTDEWIVFRMDEIYVNGNKFIPGKFEIIEGGLNSTGNEVLAEKDFSSLVTPEYKKLGKPWATIALGTFSDNPLLLKMKEAIHGKNSVDGYNALSKLCIEELENVIVWGYDEIAFDDKSYTIYSVVQFDYWSVFLSYTLVVYVIVLVVITLASFIWAKISYTRYIVKYEFDEARRNMVDALAHDLKSPLMAISGYAENIAENNNPEKHDYYAIAIMENTEYMNTIISSTLELSKTEKATALKKEQTDIAELVQSLYRKYRPEVESNGVSFKFVGAGTVEADKTLTSQAIENLITNAVKFTPSGGTISVALSSDNLTITNTCKNTEELKGLDLAAPFVKGSKSRTDRTGTGIGLSIAKTACDRQKFRLQLRAENNVFTATIKFK